MITFPLYIAKRYLKSKHKGERFISVINVFSFVGIALGVATLIIVLSVMNGFRQKLLDKIFDFNSHVAIYQVGGYLTDYENVLEKLRQEKNIQRAYPIVDEQAMFIAGKGTSGVMVRGMHPTDLANLPLVLKSLPAESIEIFQKQPYSILIGQGLAHRYGLRLGSKVQLITPQGTPSPFGMIPRQKTFQVAGIFDVGMSEYNRGFVFIPLTTAQNFFNTNTGVSALEIFFNNPHHIKEQVYHLRQLLQNPTLIYKDWQQANAPFFEAVIVERNVMFIVLSLIVLIAAFNIISGLVMLVKDKTHSIGILRAIGATRTQILKIFFATGALIGLMGTLLGAVLGIAFSLNIDHIRHFFESLLGMNLFNAEIYFLSKMPAVVSPSEVIFIIGMSLLLSFLATLYPAWKAANLDVIKALRYED